MSLSSVLSGAEKLFESAPNLFTIIDSAVQSVETSLSGVPGVSGSTKLSAATTKVNAFLTAAGTDIAVVTNVAASLSPLINAAVSIFNATGIFKHASASAA